MAVYYYKVRQTDAGNTYQKIHRVKLVTDDSGYYSAVYYNRDVSGLNLMVQGVIDGSKAISQVPPFDADSPVMYVDGISGGLNPSNFGFTNVTKASELPVGTRFYFSDTAYIEIVLNDFATESNYIRRNMSYKFVWGSRTYTKAWHEYGSFRTYTNNKQLIAADLFPVYRKPAGSLNWYFAFSCFYDASASNPQYMGELTLRGKSADSEMYSFYEYVLANVEPVDMDDPYVDIENSIPSGQPRGGGIPSGDSVTIPSLPTVSVSDTGFVTLFNPTLAQVKNLASYMWGSLFDVSTFKKIFADPMDCILGFNLLPVSIPNGGTENVIVGNISTGVSMTKAGSQWVEVDCGTINIGTPFDSYLDYSPYTKYSIYLPYIGTVDLSADDCVGRDIHLVYHVDVLSCSCVAYLKCGDSVLYQFTGSCGYSIPLTSENFRSMISSIVSIAGSIAGVVASGGASAPLTIGAVANTANNVMGLKPDIHRSGAIGSSAGLMGIQTPYLILQFPNPCKPAQQYKYMGYPSFVTVSVGDLSGYTEFDSIILDEVTCDEDEKQLIEDILKGGVFL